LEEIRIPFIGDSKRRPKNKYFGHIFGDGSLEDNGKNVPSTLTDVIVGSGAEVYDESFKNCTGIENIELQDKIHHIGKKAFSGCLSLKSISIPDYINTMGEAPFEGCPNLEYTTDDNGKYLGNSVHPHLVLSKTTSTDIESHSLHADTKIIEAKAFKDCNKLTTFDIHNKVTNIGKEAFYGCEKLTVYSEALYRPATWDQN
jgi:hypothetical protein